MAVIITNPLDFNVEDLYVDLWQSVGCRLYLKCEGFNFAGSIKIKAAVEMVAAKEREGRLRPGGTLVESSSGNMGVALSIVAASKGYRFVCVTDVRCTRAARLTMEALGGEVHVIGEPDAEGGYLGARIAHVRKLCEENAGYVWLNQYANSANWRGHYRTTGPEVAKAFPELDVLFIGAGTTGTLMGCARYFRENHPGVTIVAVDAAGSVTFGRPPGRRMIPGLGTSVRPPIFDASYADDVVYVEEAETIRMCRRLVGHGYLFGGSTGTVVSGARDWLTAHGRDDMTAVAISPDLGGNYLDTIYDEVWASGVTGADGATARPGPAESRHV
ncbi:2,3-diaminopropionate biosynthesis protein SbnA [Streptomyces sp. NPDC013157]|uniref:2,3-diaminopropionate biosynthesis protein SbnA n=1 Tax=Streptomyces sp. NPDC013157 TaxID=3364861 RepID=UPI0036C6DA00